MTYYLTYQKVNPSLFLLCCSHCLLSLLESLSTILSCQSQSFFPSIQSPIISMWSHCQLSSYKFIKWWFLIWCHVVLKIDRSSAGTVSSLASTLFNWNVGLCHFPLGFVCQFSSSLPGSGLPSLLQSYSLVLVAEWCHWPC